MKTASVAKLWQANKDNFWELGDNLVEVTLQDLYEDALDKTKLDALANKMSEAMDFHFRSDLRQHRKALEDKLWLLDTFGTFPTEHALVVFKEKGKLSKAIADGNHRLVAAKLCGLKTVPVVALHG